ncbi:hypothetical protein FGSG_04923 [Fusarium graminearum PH-1]|uniref:Chromosome 3, complete genome n=1 Tax=Gibberella zeae (strain ATCC MYA-4620 / CBS 123657 / FGSC 9075 / NRRL 31084 / PH-1) TaxID=229533 RepID=I1RLV3_GIBZE|nr:hypothetical protein FGSG_04923 [Fusarium graminearum PH-1]ESU10818.1 hypothetical protein FGSG_04923 [Fusarium graminearum PH-1]CEF86877.1 unnamed protein product [Fusarium graminearum]|eukprot:XP_011323394.1 hypothetical protein FGSG_04923 [Fusarium graminearum PH-1]
MTQQPQAKTEHILQTPLWIVIIRGFQFLFSLIIVGLCGWMIHDAGLPENSLCIAIAVLSWIVILYSLLSEKLPALRSLYHIIAVLCLDALMLVLWLAAWAATASRRAKYVVPVTVGNCYSDGSLIDSKNCSVFYKRDGENVILFKTGLAILAAIAGLGALVWVLFIVTFVWSLIMFLRGRKQGRFAIDLSGSTNNYQMEPKTEAQVNVQPQPTPVAPQYQQQPAPGQFSPQQQQQYPPQQQQYPQTTPSPYQPAQSPYQQQGAYPPPPVSPYDPQQGQQQFESQQNYAQYPPQQYHEAPGTTSPPPHQYHEAPGTTSPPPQQQPYPVQGHPQ